MSTQNEQTKLEQRALTAFVSSSLKPTLPDTLRVSLSVNQNFSLAAEEIFVHALNRTIWAYRDKYQAVEMLMGEIRNTAMESVATEQGIARISDLVFKESVMREFLFTLQVQFFSQFAEFHTNWRDMLGTISAALTSSPIGADVDSSLNLVPEDLRLRTYDQTRMKNLLLANTWLVMFILVALWGRTFSYDELRVNQRRAAGG